MSRSIEMIQATMHNPEPAAWVLIAMLLAATLDPATLEQLATATSVVTGIASLRPTRGK
ncbi:hypothetical protein [Streptomyces sp. NPDC058657]|uniref:hypothetical protein n=1 Tax=unclassified Streptomyces TaxID=2593676 RepID=UPI0036554026